MDLQFIIFIMKEDRRNRFLEQTEAKSFAFLGIAEKSNRELSLLDGGIVWKDSREENAFYNLENLQELDVQGNELEGSLPPCLSNLSSLQLLDLSYNRLSGQISSSLISSLTMIRFLSLSSNRFEGSLSFSSFANLSKLEVVELSVLKANYPYPEREVITYPNQLEIETESTPWTPKFQLKALLLSNCNINKLTGTIPSFLSTQYDLIALELSHNNIKGKFPSWLLEKNERLQMLDLGSNSLAGPFHLPPHSNNLNAYYLDVSSNHIYGQLPENIGFCLPNLLYLNMSANALHGTFPLSMGNMRELFTLDLSRNNFSEEIPEQLAMGCIRLEILKLSNNRLQGLVFPTCLNLTWLQYLYLDGNQFSGRISAGIFKSPHLQLLDVGKNNISGRLPAQIGNFSELMWLSMPKNYLEGPIPANIGTGMELPGYRIKVGVPYIIVRLTKAEEEVEFITKKRSETYKGDVLYLMSSVDLSWNQLSGENPPQLTKLNFLSTFNVSHNNLSGILPDMMKGQFGTFGETSYEDNPPLCGPPLKSCFTSPLPPSMPTTSGDEDNGHDIIFYACFPVSCTMSFLLFIALLYINRYWRGLYFYFVDACIYSCYYFALDKLRKVCNIESMQDLHVIWKINNISVIVDLLEDWYQSNLLLLLQLIEGSTSPGWKWKYWLGRIKAICLHGQVKFEHIFREAVRLNLLLPKLISPEQGAFIKDRPIAEHIALA
ncbi:receptor-like protein 15 [Magnolia sinica]|uniref:receptor-like protein 15 n=1 Tax=Magnolia sinica TaxID=86752 RepID=UPI00265A2B67|nr:receptor-like protein 15 [Magnolia sinica]